MIDAEADALVAELAADGVVVTPEQAQIAVLQVAELLLLVRMEQAHWKPVEPKRWEDLLLSLAQSVREQ